MRRHRRLRHVRALAIKPGVDIALAEPPLTANANRGDFPSLDQAVNGTKVYLEILQDLFRRQEHFIGWQMESQSPEILP